MSKGKAFEYTTAVSFCQYLRNNGGRAQIINDNNFKNVEKDFLTLHPEEQLDFPVIYASAKNGIAKIAPTNVPRNAIAIVSNNKYGTPFVVKFNNKDVSGVTIPCKIL